MVADFNCEASGLAGQQWGGNSAEGSLPVVALHGWLDNSDSFRLLAQQPGWDTFVALDLPGHGASPWKPAGADYAIWNYTGELSRHLSTYAAPVHLIAHSMGGSAALCLAAAFPELVRSLVLIDSPGPIITPENMLAKQLRQGVEASYEEKEPRRMVTTEEAVAVRKKATPRVGDAVLEALVLRNLKPAGDGFVWRTDPRLKLASKLRLTESQVAGLMGSVECPVLAIRAINGMIPTGLFEQRVAYLKQAKAVDLAGYHHLHTEDDVAGPLASMIQEFQETL